MPLLRGRLFLCPSLPGGVPFGYTRCIMCKRIIFILLVLALSVPALAGGGRIHGAVVDSAGNPVVGARVQCVREIARVSLTAFTTEAGEYAFNDVPPGIYELGVTLRGVVLGGAQVEMLLPVDREADFMVDAGLAESARQ